MLLDAERILGGDARNLRVIVLLREVRQHDKSRATVVTVVEEFRECGVRKVPHARQNALFYRPRIRPDAQHFQIMIRLDHQPIAAAQMVLHALRHVTEIGDESDLDAIDLEGESDGIDRVVWDGERGDGNVTYLETASG